MAREGRWADAEKALLRVLRFDTERPSVLFNLGTIYAESGRYREALAHWQRLIDQAPDSEYASRARVQAQVASSLDSVIDFAAPRSLV